MADGCTGCPHRETCSSVCPYIEALLYNTNTSARCVHNKEYCFNDLGEYCLGGTGAFYYNVTGMPAECADKRCQRFIGCELGNPKWSIKCHNETSCPGYKSVAPSNSYKYGIECGFKKEIAYDGELLETVRQKLLLCFGVVADDPSVTHKPPVNEIKNMVHLAGLDCGKCPSVGKCTAFKLCQEMYGALTRVLTEGVEEDIGENMSIKIKMLTGGKFVTPEIRLKVVKLLKCEKFLPKRQRDCMWLYFIDGLAQKDIAALMSAYRCNNPDCTFFSPEKLESCPRCGTEKFVKSSITSQAVNRYIKWGLSNIRKKFLIDMELFKEPEFKKSCEVCGVDFITKHAHQRYCVTDCRVRLYTERRREIRREKRKRYSAKRAAEGKVKRRILSKERRTVEHIELETIVCAFEGCNKKFVPAPYQRYCSKSCRLKSSRQKYQISIPSLGDVQQYITRR